MGQLRTANKRKIRALFTKQARQASAEIARPISAETSKAAA